MLIRDVGQMSHYIYVRHECDNRQESPASTKHRSGYFGHGFVRFNELALIQ